MGQSGAARVRSARPRRAVVASPLSRDDGLMNKLMLTLGLMLATFMTTLDSTIAIVALPHIQGSVSASQDQATWVLTSYMVGTAVMTPLSGWLSLKIGRKPTFLVSIIGFVVTSILCGLASSLPEIVVYRLLQGAAGAAMTPLSQAANRDIWRPEQIPKVMAVWAGTVMIGPILGPTVGGWLTENYSWRWVFYINVPIGAASLALVYTFMERDRGGRARPFDLMGFGALVIFMLAFQLMVDRGPGKDWFSSPEICVEAVLALCAIWVFVMQSLTAEHPFFPRELLRDRAFVTSIIFGFFVMAVLFSTSALIPTLMQQLLGYSAMQSGFASMPRGLGSLLGFILVPGLARKFGGRPVIAVGVLLSIWGLMEMSRFDLAMTARPIEVTGFVQGLAMAWMFNPLSVLLFATLPAALRVEAAVLNNVVRTIGGSLGIATLQAMLIHQNAVSHEALAGRIVPTDPLIRWVLPPFLTPESSGALAALNGEVTRQASMIAYDTVFGWLAVGSALVLPLVLIMKPAKPQPGEVIEVHAD